VRLKQLMQWMQVEAMPEEEKLGYWCKIESICIWLDMAQILPINLSTKEI
jgi:hypothetical protein